MYFVFICLSSDDDSERSNFRRSIPRRRACQVAAEAVHLAEHQRHLHRLRHGRRLLRHLHHGNISRFTDKTNCYFNIKWSFLNSGASYPRFEVFSNYYNC